MDILILNDHERISPRVILEAETLASTHTVHICYWDRGGDFKPDVSGATVTSVEVRSPTGQLELLPLIPLVYYRMFCRALRLNPDVIHCTHLILLPIAVLISRFNDAELVYDAYERHVVTLTQRYFRGYNWILTIFKSVEKLLVHYTSYVLTVDSPNNTLASYYRSTNRRVTVIYNVPALLSDRSSLLDFSSDDKLVYVGGMSKAKGVLMALRLVDQLRNYGYNVSLDLIGVFHDSETEANNLISNRNLSSAVTVRSWMEYEELIEHIARCTIGLALHQPCTKFKYVAKGTGRKFFTYMQAGLPIVAPKWYSIADIVREVGCGIEVDTTDVDAITECVMNLLDNPSLRQTLGRRGRKAFETRYNWEEESRKLMAVYRSILADKQS